jgi:hypothetical protein
VSKHPMEQGGVLYYFEALSLSFVAYIAASIFAYSIWLDQLSDITRIQTEYMY